MKPCINCGGCEWVDSVDNTGAHYLGCARCVIKFWLPCEQQPGGSCVGLFPMAPAMRCRALRARPRAPDQ